MATNIPQYSFIAQMYGSEHSARRRGDSSRPFFNPNQMVLMCRNDMNCNANNANMQRHFVEFRGCDTMNCNINGGNMQCHFMQLRGYGHDKSDPYGC